LNAWNLEDTRNEHDLTEIYKRTKLFKKLNIDQLFVQDLNVKGTR